MRAVAIDASVGVKWFVPEILAAEARQWRTGPDSLNVPAVFFDLEIANILWKKVGKGELTRDEADTILSEVAALPVIRHAETHIIAMAFDFANRTHRTVYDCLYLALAIQLGGRMVTTDQRFFNSLKSTTFASHVCWVADFPGP